MLRRGQQYRRKLACSPLKGQIKTLCWGFIEETSWEHAESQESLQFPKTSLEKKTKQTEKCSFLI